MLFYYYNGGSLGATAVRLGPQGFSLTEAAESGILGFGRIRIDDVAGSLDMIGHRSLTVKEPDCTSDPWLFRGYLADRTIMHQDSLNTGVQRVWDCTVADLNSAMQWRVIRSGGKRPEETDTARLAWLLGTDYIDVVSSDGSHVFGAGVTLDANDYRGQTPADVVADCAQVSGCNWFVVWDNTLNAPALHYYLPSRAHFSSTLKISNVLADVDESTVFAPDTAVSLSLDPSRVYTGVRYGFGGADGGRDSAVFEESATILSSIGHKREANWGDPSIRKSARATAKADKWLEEGETEAKRIIVTLNKVPGASVNLIRTGHRIQVKFSHLPGYESYTWVRVVRRTVQQMDGTQLLYAIQLELSNVKQAGGKNRHPASPLPPDLDDGSTYTTARWCWSTDVGRDDGHGGIPDDSAFDGPDGATHDTIKEAVAYSTPYIYAGCPFGQSGYSGVTHEEQWYSFTTGTLDGVIGVLVTYNIDWLEGIAGDFGFIQGVASAVPTADYDFQEISRTGAIPVGTYTFFIPRSMLVPSATNYAVIAPAWRAQDGVFACSGTITGGYPLAAGDFISGRAGVNGCSVKERLLDGGAGWTTWVPPVGDVDGSNTVYTLTDWNGKGIPKVSLNGLELAYGEDYSYDSDAGTITLTSPPWTGADIRVRYPI